MEHKRISKQVTENTETIAMMTVIKNELLKEFLQQEDEEDVLKETIKSWLEDPTTTDRTKLRYILSKIEKIDKIQDQIIEKITEKIVRTLLMNREANGLWKQYEPKGGYYTRKAACRMPLFDK
ncbi:transcriptional regulator of heat shock response [Thermosipho japonicus]|uniref:Transcriptional regulator of heat shock response n=2 Tax=Thermosipho japonicus TaxID=90323 RepID=A0A841GTS9_9BACT|nr:transcriptional regulator of heat shock response [Thermosipho japonicus]